MVDYHPRPRFLEDSVAAALRDTPVVLVHGARQTGKTTLVRQLAGAAFPAHYITLDDAVVLASAREDPAAFLAALSGPAVIDEIQRAPELFLAIKAEVDRRRRPGRFLLTGSANVFLVPRLSDSLAGRMEILTLWPFSHGELSGRQEAFIGRVFGKGPLPAAGRVPDISGLLLAGGYPPVLARTRPDRRHAWFGAYITTILERDIRDLAHLDGLTALPRLLALIASRTANLVNFADLARGLAIPLTTLKRYFALLEATFLVELLPAWWSNLGKRLIKAPKLYLNDTGLAGYLLGLNEDRLRREPTLRGALLENFVAMELRKQATWSRLHPKLFHFRTPAGAEVDLVLENAGGDIVGIEVKASSTVSGHDFAGLRALADLAGPKFRRGILLYTGAASVPFGPQLSALPLSALWAPA